MWRKRVGSRENAARQPCVLAGGGAGEDSTLSRGLGGRGPVLPDGSVSRALRSLRRTLQSCRRSINISKGQKKAHSHKFFLVDALRKEDWACPLVLVRKAANFSSSGELSQAGSIMGGGAALRSS